MSALSPPTVQLENLSLRLGGLALFQALDLRLESGCWTCLLGQSGTGKTSLLRAVAGLLEPDGGRIQASDGRPLHGRIAYMAQQDLLLPWLSALDNVTLGSRLRGERSAQHKQKARDLLAQVGLAGAENMLPEALSGGMRQRVALARTLMEDRPVVLMDEPFSALDALTRCRLQTLAARLLAGRTVLLVTHDPFEALRLGHVIDVLAGTPTRLMQSLKPPGKPPRSPDDADLLALHGRLLSRLAGEAA